ncbi:MAG: hypothetical protein GDA40_04735, partial [Rhodobacteraceae bacterium]|nr:hypothetical protein [Paracoccaceae bacterium]
MKTTPNHLVLSAVVAAVAAIGGVSALSAGPWDSGRIVIRKTSEIITDLNIDLGNNVSYGLRTPNMRFAPVDLVYSGTASGTPPTAEAKWRGSMRAIVL